MALVHGRVVPEVVVRASSKTGEGLGELMEAVEQALLSLNAMVSCLVPYAKGDLLNDIHTVGTIVEEEFVEEGTRVVAYVPPSLRGRLKEYIQD
uniref:Uncharacterized protein n=1 Tax=Hemiselmis andersenii TaxID=464988 RepID=A0A7S0THY0_HEMAN